MLLAEFQILKKLAFITLDSWGTQKDKGIALQCMFIVQFKKICLAKILQNK